MHHISWYRAKEGSICFSYVKNQNDNDFQPLIIVLFFSASYFLEMVMPIR